MTTVWPYGKYNKCLVSLIFTILGQEGMGKLDTTLPLLNQSMYYQIFVHNRLVKPVVLQRESIAELTFH